MYIQLVLWPFKTFQETKASISSSSSHFTLLARSYSFSFRLRLPVNSCCQPPPSVMSMQNFHFTNNSIATVSHPLGHVKQTLPPTLVGIDDAWIRYPLSPHTFLVNFW